MVPADLSDADLLAEVERDSAERIGRYAAIVAELARRFRRLQGERDEAREAAELWRQVAI